MLSEVCGKRMQTTPSEGLALTVGMKTADALALPHAVCFSFYIRKGV
jgi:hypothetical protein